MKTQRINYKINLRLDLAKLSAPVQELEEGINSALASWGVQERMNVTSTVPLYLQVGQQLTQKEKRKICDMIETSFAKYGGKVVSFRRQSGNVSQEAVSVS